MTKREASQEKSGRLTWALHGRTYVPTTTSRGLGRIDEDRAKSMTDEGGPLQSERVEENKAGWPERQSDC
jgi:hypothetical protein